MIQNRFAVLITRLLLILQGPMKLKSRTEDQIREDELLLRWLAVEKGLRHYEIKDGALYVHREKRKVRRPPLHSLARFADWIPLKTRKAVKAMAGDYAAEIRVFRRQRRYWVARWNVVLAWGFALWYVFKAPFSAIVSLLKKLLGSSLL